MAAVIPVLPGIITGATALLGSIVGFLQMAKSSKEKVHIRKLEAELNEMKKQLIASDKEKSDLKQRLENNITALEENIKELTEKMVMDLTGLEKEEELKDLIETFLRCAERYADDEASLITETKEFERKFMLQLTRVKNSMENGNMSLPRIKVWVDGAVLDMKMLAGLVLSGVAKPSVIQKAGSQFQGDFSSMSSRFTASNALSSNVEEIRALEASVQPQLQVIENYMNGTVAVSSSPHLTE